MKNPHENTREAVYLITCDLLGVDEGDCLFHGGVRGQECEPRNCECTPHLDKWTDLIIAAVERDGASK